MINLTSLSMQIIDSDPDGIKICRIAGSTLVTIVVPRDLLKEAKELPDIPPRGIYYLIDDRKGRLNQVYAGQTVQGVRRLDDHKSRKDWWNKAVMFLAPDNEFSMDIVSGLESAAIQYIREHGSYEVANLDSPRPYINPYNESFIYSLLDDILFRMTVLGFNLDAMGETDDESIDETFHTTRRGVRALGRYNSGEGTFDVLPGSDIDLSNIPGTDRTPIGSLIQKREDLVSSGDIQLGDCGYPKLQVIVQFASPSAAAEFVLGGSCNGWTEWTDSQGRTLSAVYRGDQYITQSNENLGTA